MKDAIARFWSNVRAGSRLARFRPIAQGDFHVSLEQLMLLAVFDLFLTICFEWLETQPDPVFYSGGFAFNGFSILMLLVAAAMTALWLSRNVTPLAMSIMVFSSLPFLSLVFTIIILLSKYLPEGTIQVQSWVFMLLVAWMFAVIVRPSCLEYENTRFRFSKALALYAIVWFLPVSHFASDSVFWYSVNEDYDTTDEYTAYRELDVEAVFYRQHDLLEQTLEDILPERPEIEDLYFVGFSSYARQDVFLKEIRIAQDLFDSRFDTSGRSLVMVNHLSTQEGLPLASRSNLKSALAHIGGRMDKENDVLVMFLTSHGSKKELSVDFWPLKLNNLTPQHLRSDLDAAGIQWRVIMISACYSGTFIEALRDPYTMVLTAASTDRKSFGCGDNSEMTYFGEALLKHQLQHSYSFEDAFTRAAAEISEREQTEELEPSNPQIYIGDKIRDKLAHLAGTLKARLETRHTDNNIALSENLEPIGVD